MNQTPWWVAGAIVHARLNTLIILCAVSRISVEEGSVDDIDGFCLREQLWHDGIGVGFNTDATRLFREAMKRMRKEP